MYLIEKFKNEMDMISHYYIERFLSVSLYAGVSVILAIALSWKQISVKVALKTYTIILSTLAWFFIPAQTMDLYRLWITASTYNWMPLGDMYSTLMSSRWSNPFSIFLISAVSKINPHLLPTLTVFLFYSNISYIICDYSERYNVRRDSTVAIVFLFLSRGIYGEVMSGIRCMLAFSFVARCIYNEIYNKKKARYSFIYYICALLLHNAAIPAIGIWMAVKIFTTQNKKKRNIYVLCCLVVVVLLFQYFNGVVYNVVKSASSYIESDSQYFYIWEYIFNGLYLLLVNYVVIIKSKPINMSLSLEGRTNKAAIIMFSFVCILFFSTYAIFHRYASFVTMFSIPLLIEIVSDYTNQTNSRVLRNNIIIIAALFMILSGLKGNLNGIRFFTL